MHDEIKDSKIFWGDFHYWEFEQNYSSHCRGRCLIPTEIDLYTLCGSRY